MKRMTVSLALAFATTLGLTACGPEQDVLSDNSATESTESSLSLCPPVGYYLCPPTNMKYYYYSPVCEDLEFTAPYVERACEDLCGQPCTRHTGS